jgi:hypothetical protein
MVTAHPAMILISQPGPFYSGSHTMKFACHAIKGCIPAILFINRYKTVIAGFAMIPMHQISKADLWMLVLISALPVTATWWRE